MKKTIYRKALPLVAFLVSLASCGPSNNGGDTHHEDEDPTKVNIVIGNLDTGFGNTWIENAAKRYEELHKDDVFGDLKGVNVIVDSTSDTLYPRDASSILSDNIDVHFRENMEIDTLIAGNALMDLSEVLNSPNEYDGGKTIISKISEDDKKVYSKDNKIYAAPMYSGSYGLIYNKSIFSDKKLYIAKSTPENAKSISEVNFTNRDNSKSAGYDGISGTFDDGLPRTYIEFYALLNEASKKGDIIPMGWSSKYAESYVTQFLVSAYSSTAGYEQAKLRYSFEGEANNLGRLSGGTFVKDLQPTTITNGIHGNGYELMRSKANYDVLSFYKKIVSDSSYFIEQESEFDHYTMQEYMVNGYTTKTDTMNVAMTIDGTWFYNELKKHVTDGQIGEAEFGFMPIPKQTFEGVTDRKYVFTEEGRTCAFVKGNITDENKKKVALDFVKFFYSDSELLNFAKTTQCVIGVKYPDLDKESEDYKALGSFGRDVYELTHNSWRINVNYPNDFLLHNRNKLVNSNFFTTTNSPNPVKSLLGSKTAEEYYNDIVEYYSSSTWSSLVA